MLKKALGILSIILVILFSCQKDDYADSDTEKINYTTDTLFFDTVFTTIGSSTRRFKIKNPNKKPIIISSLKIAGGNNSPFRINVDGVSAIDFNNIEIRAKDSIWVFAEVTIDPNAGNLPFIVKDSIVFSTNGNIQDVKLVAFGQNAIYHRPANGQSSFVLNMLIADDTVVGVEFFSPVADDEVTAQRTRLFFLIIKCEYSCYFM